MIVTALRRRACALLLASLVASLLTVAAAPAEAQQRFTVSQGPAERVLGGVTHRTLRINFSDGRVARGNVLRLPANDPHVELRPRKARGTAVGLQTTSQIARGELSRGAIAGTNGGYWLNRPGGVPNGPYVHAGRLVGPHAAMASGLPVPAGRGVIGIHASGQTVFDRVGVQLTLHRPDGQAIAVSELNRRLRTDASSGANPVSGELVVFDPLYGAAVAVPAGGVVVVTDRLRIGSNGAAAGTVRTRQTVGAATTLAVPADASLLVAWGTETHRLDSVFPGTSVQVATQLSPQAGALPSWDNLAYALPGGPLLARNGTKLFLASWRDEAFSDSHLTGRHPRTAVARLANGDTLLVTIDGRQPGWSDGISLSDLRDLLVDHMGARDALNLDGGGSTVMTVGGEVRNRFSDVVGGRRTERSVANALLLYAPLPPEARNIRAFACDPERVRPSGFRDIAGNTHEAAIECLAWWQVTTGTTPTTYDPTATVRRDQMASFIARWMDQSAERGNVRALPATASHRFLDVSAGNVHEPAIARLAAAGIVQGIDSQTYRPASPVTRAQMATFIDRAYSYMTGAELPRQRDMFFDDNGNVHEAAIDRLASAGIVQGTGGLTYNPTRAVNRAAMSSFIMRSADHLIEAGRTQPPA